MKLGKETQIRHLIGEYKMTLASVNSKVARQQDKCYFFVKCTPEQSSNVKRHIFQSLVACKYKAADECLGSIERLPLLSRCPNSISSAGNLIFEKRGPCPCSVYIPKKSPKIYVIADS